MSVATKPLKKAAEKITSMTTPQPRWCWYHGAAFYVLVQVLAFGLAYIVSVATGKKVSNVRDMFGDVSYFKHLNQSIFSPPSWAFGPAWTINNISTIWGNLQVLNMPDDTPGKDSFLALQGASWFTYVIFNAAYFSLRSPINAFVLTFSMFIMTIMSIFVAIFQLKNTKVALSLATLTIWLTIASTAAAFQVAWNHDDLYQAGPFTAPVPSLEKETVS